MANDSFKIKKSLNIEPIAGATPTAEGDLAYNSSTNKLSIHNGTSASPVVTEAHTATLTNKTLTAPVISTISNTGTLTLPTSTDTLVGRATTDTLTNKTLTAPVISTISNTGTLTLPTSTDTLVGRATTDTLTNKTISGASNTITNVSLTTGVTGTLPVTNGGTGLSTIASTAVPFASAVDTLTADANKISFITASNRFYVGAIGIATAQLNTNATSASNLAFYAAHTSGNVAVINSQSTHINTLFTHSDNTAGNGVQINVQRARGTTGSRTQAQSGDLIGEIKSQAYINSSTVTTHGIAVIQFYLDEAATAGSCGGSLRMCTTPTGTITPKERLRLQQDGSLEFVGATSGYVAVIPPATVTSHTLTLPSAQGAANSWLQNNGSGTLSWSTTLTTPTTDIITLDGQGSTPSTPSSGFYKAYVKDSTGKLTILDSAGTETTVGSGSGGGGINYISNPDAETATTGWATYADAAGTTPVNGTGGSPNSTFTRSTSSPLRSTASFLWTKNSGASRQGEGFSYDFTIDAADKGKVLQGSFDYAIASGTFVDDAMEVFVYDVTNAALIYCSPSKLKNHSLAAEKFGFEFQTSSSSTSYRLIVHVGVSTDSSNTIKFDNFSVGPQAKLYGSPVTDWQAWTPTGGWTGAVTYTGFKRQVGSDMEYDIKVTTSGAPTGTTLTVNLLETIDTAKLADSSANTSLGVATVQDTTGILSPGVVAYNTSTSVKVLVLNTAGTYADASAVSATSPFTFANTDYVTLKFKVPIVGKSSSVLMSSDASTRVVAARAYLGSNFSHNSSGSFLKINTFSSESHDTHGAFDNSTNSRFTAPVSGYYRVSGHVSFAANATGERVLAVYKNGSTNIGRIAQIGNPSGTNENKLSGSDTFQLNAGDYVELWAYQNSGGTLAINSNTGDASFSTFAVEQVQGPAQIAASETVAWNGYTTSTQSMTSSFVQVTNWSTTSDSHNAFNTSTSTYTVPANGRYRISGQLQYAAAAGSYLVLPAVYKNGSAIGYGSRTITNTTFPVAPGFSNTYRFLAGDTITIYGYASTSTALAAGTATTDGHWSIERIGNY